MKRKNILITHIIATVIALITIGTFFNFSLIAELRGQTEFIRQVKRGILYSLPVMILTMPALVFTGKKLAGKSKHPAIIRKMKRMKFVTINGVLLITLAVYLFYHAHYRTIDLTFLIIQILELGLGFTNLVLIGLNAKERVSLSQKSGVTGLIKQ